MMSNKITDPAVLAACSYINDFYEHIAPLAPKRGSAEEQHAIHILASYIRDNGLALGDD